ncbi:hypothetical protein N7478_007786 [Penicillium angulare]|uniref:uncharacterized protein n=1 Tax=Penicillium angulare TaxID=116970 RepID=UPI0025424EE0|nr:uncharacterized protein N7478_007786 [Penicillium angulare]KAJ5272661.1 hypothetical protein N7478_007786 [Penicillium angulare]
MVHGPHALYGDCDGETEETGKVKMQGDGYLLREITRVKPRMVICGHMHGAYGTTVIRHDGIQEVEDGLEMDWRVFGLIGALKLSLRGKINRETKAAHPKVQETLVVNAAVSPSRSNPDFKSPIAVNLH